ncbi:hypothetical protein [Geobacillus thermodenitrificans]|uniref:hypothetical protein n=1 Tax=Geobacillus thermodenitrificans TaxID=33940 RepID=UPI0012F80483|nr:hypothetical protein [Geobacillus thermodenitrificans]
MHWKPRWNASTGLWKRALNKRRLCPKQSRFFRARCSGGDFAKISRMHDFSSGRRTLFSTVVPSRPEAKGFLGRCRRFARTI